MIQKKLNVLKGQRGFTLIELMATLVILAIIIAIAVPAVGNLTAKSKDSADKSSIALMERAGEMAELDGLDFDDNNPEKPASLTEKDIYMVPTLIEKGYLKLDNDSDFNKPTNYVKKMNKSGKYKWMGKGGTDTGGGTPNDGDDDEWVSKYRPFVTQVLTDEFNKAGQRMNFVDERIGETYGDLACAKWNNMTDDTVTWDRQDDCSNHYRYDVFGKGLEIYKTRISTDEFTPDLVIRSGMSCLYEHVNNEAPPASMTTKDMQMDVMTYLAGQGLDVMSPEGQGLFMKWVVENTDCGGLMTEDPMSVLEKLKLKALIDEVTKQMDINNDYVPEDSNQ